jgi:uncharacterized repeat protein (TIGR01451 family)
VETLGCKLKQLYDRLCVIEKRRRTITIVLAICTMIFLSGLLSSFIVANVRSLYQSSSSISSVGTLKAIGIKVYRNQELTHAMTNIDWSILEPGEITTYTIYVRNEGNSPLTLSMSLSNWYPSSASNYLTLTWDYDGQTIGVGKAVKVTLTLAVSPSITGIGNFHFDLTLVGSE